MSLNSIDQSTRDIALQNRVIAATSKEAWKQPGAGRHRVRSDRPGEPGRRGHPGVAGRPRRRSRLRVGAGRRQPQPGRRRVGHHRRDASWPPSRRLAGRPAVTDFGDVDPEDAYDAVDPIPTRLFVIGRDHRRPRRVSPTRSATVRRAGVVRLLAASDRRGGRRWGLGTSTRWPPCAAAPGSSSTRSRLGTPRPRSGRLRHRAAGSRHGPPHRVQPGQRPRRRRRLHRHRQRRTHRWPTCTCHARVRCGSSPAGRRTPTGPVRRRGPVAAPTTR